ncbi:MAG TPA: hypothetical protein VNA69_17125 [Thermoanaerobaculia bacterium]|nr:hypothetical protein [Thermoanaerobaculia bacterium]
MSTEGSATLNPIFDLYRSKSSLIERTRAAVLTEVRRTSTGLAATAEEVLVKKLRSDLPPLGEMLPWVLGELSGVSPAALNRLARGWLAIYLYGHLLDERADRNERLTSEEQLLCWILFQFGLHNLHSVTHGTPFEAGFERYLSSAVKYQMQDLSDRGQRHSSRRARYSSGKNNCLVACAAAVAATRRANPRVVEFTLRLVPGLQHLDDIADLTEDAQQGNYTELLGRALGGRVADLAECDELEIIDAAVRSGALETILAAAEKALVAARKALGAKQWQAIRETPSGMFFDRLDGCVRFVRHDVESIRRELLDAPSPAREQRLIRSVRQKVKLVAQGS